MSSLNDPIRRLTIKLRLVWVAGLVALLGAGAWAWRPPERELDLQFVPPPPSSGDEPRSAPPPDEFNRDAFAATLWNPPPPDGTDAAAEALLANTTPAAPPPLLELIGITIEGELATAAIYDPQADRLSRVASGDRIGPYIVTAVTEQAVELTVGGRTVHLRLDEPVAARGRS